MLVNQPTVRVRSTPAPNSSSRPWPSRAMRTRGLPVHAPTTSASAASSTSLICVRYAAGTSCSRARVSSASSRRFTERARSSDPSPRPSTGRGADAASPCASQ